MTRSPVALGIAAALLTAAAVGAEKPEKRPLLEKPHRRLVVCFDGTLNNAEQEVVELGNHKVFKPTNVLKTFRAVLPVASDGKSQLIFYTEGVGGVIGEPDLFGRELVFLDQLNGGAFATGFEANIKAGYRFLVANYEPGDEIFIFGFSRGAAQAQSLARFIDYVGGLLHKGDEYWLIALFDSYRNSLPPQSSTAADLFWRIRHPKEEARSAGHPADACGYKNLPRRDGCMARPRPPKPEDYDEHIQDPQPVKIRFLGVWDTVLSTGARILSDFCKQDVPTVCSKYDFHIGRDGKPPAIVTTVRQALAIDEHRWDFRPQIWRSPASPEQSLKQLWFPGVHSNIGGGYYLDGLADGALQWMIGEAQAAGLDVDCYRLDRYYTPCVLGTRCDSDKGFFAVQEFLRGKRGRGVRDLTAGNHIEDAGIAVHESAAYLLVVDPTYRPVNLLSFLAQDANRIPHLPDAAQQAKLLAIVEDFKRQSPAEAARFARQSLKRCPNG